MRSPRTCETRSLNSVGIASRNKKEKGNRTNVQGERERNEVKIQDECKRKNNNRKGGPVRMIKMKECIGHRISFK